MLSGKSENYLNVYLTGDEGELNRFIKVKIEKKLWDGVYGERIV